MEAIFIPIIVIGIIAFIAWIIYLAAKRRKELAAWAASHGLTFDKSRQYEFDTAYPEYDCLRKGSNRFAFNTIRGEYNGHQLLFFDYHYETYSHDKNGRKTHHHYFSGLILPAPIPLKSLHIRPERFFDKITEFFGYDDIDFESAEFSRKFYVKSPNKRWAFDVIHPRTMEFLLAKPRYTIQFDRSHAIAYRGSRFSVAELESAADTLHGIFERLPDYLIKQQLEK